MWSVVASQLLVSVWGRSVPGVIHFYFCCDIVILLGLFLGHFGLGTRNTQTVINRRRTTYDVLVHAWRASSLLVHAQEWTALIQCRILNAHPEG